MTVVDIGCVAFHMTALAILERGICEIPGMFLFYSVYISMISDKYLYHQRKTARHGTAVEILLIATQLFKKSHLNMLATSE